MAGSLSAGVSGGVPGKAVTRRVQNKPEHRGPDWTGSFEGGADADNDDVALSFPEEAGCDDIWERIGRVPGKDPWADVAQDLADEPEAQRFRDV